MNQYLELSNFGISAQGHVKLLDLDQAYFDRLFLGNPLKTCRKNSDCSMYDCSGYCDRRTRRCHQRRINNNLQILCERVLLPLLKSRSIPLRLHDVLFSYVGKCAAPQGRYKQASALKIGASSRILRIMQMILEGELKLANITSNMF